MLNVSWIFRDRKSGDRGSTKFFIKAIAQTDSEQMYATDIMIMIVNEFWS